MGFVSADPTNAQKAYYRWNSASPLFCCILFDFTLFNFYFIFILFYFIFILFLFYFYFIFILFYFILFYPHPLVLPAIPRQLGALAKETAFYSHATGMLQAC